MIRIGKLVGDKSISQRAAILAGLANGESILRNYSDAEDCEATLAAVERLGVTIDRDEDLIRVQGVNGEFSCEDGLQLDLRNSGTGFRLLSGALAGQRLSLILTGDSSLSRRPMDRIVDPLMQMGAKLYGQGKKHYPPLELQGVNPLMSINWRLEPASAQVKSAILFATLFAEGETVIDEPMRTRDHTERLFSSTGIHIDRIGDTIRMMGNQRPDPFDINIPNDFSAAAFFIALGLMKEDVGGIELSSVGLNPSRTALLTVLKDMDADVTVEEIGEERGEPVGKITVMPSRLKGIEVPIELVPNLIDEIPILAVLATAAKGKTVVRGSSELRVKESDRIQSIVNMLTNFSIKVDEEKDGFTVHEGKLNVVDTNFESYNDHRIAMSILIAAAVVGTYVHVNQSECIMTSFPSFFACMDKVYVKSNRD